MIPKALRGQSSPLAVPRLVQREARARWAARAVERRLSVAARRGRRIVVGPFVGEVGFEILYWIPMLRHLLARAGIDRKVVVALSRGRTASWYRDIAAGYVDVLDLVDPEEYSRELRDRRVAAGDQKQLTIEALDRRLFAAAERMVGEAEMIHPALMYTRLRTYWKGESGLSAVTGRVRWRKIDPPDSPIDLRDRRIAFKPYFSACFPDTMENRDRVMGILKSLAEEGPTITLPSPHGFGDQGPLGVPNHPGVTHFSHEEDRPDLGAQTAIASASRLLVTTYGGFSYLGPLLGLPTIALYSAANFNPAHRAVVEAANMQLGPSPYVVTHPADVPLPQSVLAEGMP